MEKRFIDTYNQWIKAGVLTLVFLYLLVAGAMIVFGAWAVNDVRNDINNQLNEPGIGSYDGYDEPTPDFLSPEPTPSWED